jgi:hypothetical protein
MATTMIKAPVETIPINDRLFKPIIEAQAFKRKHGADDKAVDFDPKPHIKFEEPKSILMMEDIGIPKDTGVSPMAVSDPFRLFSQECIDRFREEVLSPAVMEHCSYKSNIAAMQLRGCCPK